MAAIETIQTICNLRARVKTWYGGCGSVWLSILIVSENVEGVVGSFSLRGEEMGVDVMELSGVRSLLSVSVDVNVDILGRYFRQASRNLPI